MHVDDDQSLLEVSKQILSMENNFETDNVTSVDEALKKMEQNPYDAVVSDYEMPQKNGLEFLKILREQKNDVAFIIFTGRGREDVAVKALNLGADCYLNKNGSPETVYCELADAINKTVERKKSRELLAKSESKYHALVENSLQGISILLAAPLRIVFANGAFGKILGYSSQELMSLSPEGIMSLVYQEDRAVFFKRMEDRLLGKAADACYEFRAMRKDSSIIWLSSLSNRVDYEGQAAVQGMFLDINESKKTGEILRESEERYRELANSLPNIVFETDLNGQLEFANERAAEISGYSLNEIERGFNILQFIVPEDREKAMKNIQRLLSGGSYVPAEYRFLRKNGTTFPALITATPRICKNKVTGLRGIVLDISEQKKSEEVVKKSESRYRELSNFLPEIVFETDLTGKITFFNQRAFEITGFTPEDLGKGMNMLSFVVPEERERAMQNTKKTLDREEHSASEYRLFRKNGTIYPAIVRTAPIISENKVSGLRGVAIDITDRKKTEVSLKESEEKFRNLSEESPNMIFIHVHGRIVYANKKCEEILHYKKEEFYSPDFSFLSLVAPEYVELTNSSYASHIKGEEVPPYELVLVTRDGKRINAIIASKLIDYEGEKAILGIATDITESKKMDERLKINEKKYDTLINATDTGYVIMDGKGLVLDANLEYVRLTGHKTLDQIKGRSVTEWTAKHDLKRNAEEVKKCYREGFVRNLEIDYVDENGKITPIEINGTVMESEQDSVIVTLCRDITERKKAEQAVSASLKRYQSFIEVTGELGWTTNAAGEVLEDIPSFRNFTGQTYDEVKGWGWTKAVHPEDVEHATRAWQAAVAAKTKYEVEYRLRRCDGVYRNFIARGAPILEEDGKIREWVGTCIDITERKEAEEALIRERNTLESVTSASGAGLVIISKDYHVLWANDFIKRYKGDTIGKLCYASLNSLDSPCRDCGVAKIYAGKTTLDSHEYCSTTVDGNLYWVEIVATPIRDERGNVTSAVEIAVDITERKKNEEKLRESIHKNDLFNEKLLVVGSLTRHDVGNKLMVVKSNLYLLKKQIGDNPKLAKYLEDINLAINQSDEMFEFSRFYEKIGVEEPSKIDATQCFNEAVTLLPNLGIIRIVNDCQGLEVMADSLLKQLFYNFVDNSLKHGEIVTQIRVHFTDEGDGVKLFYEDDGVGIPEANKPKLFHEGFTTGKSTGLGLFFIKKMVEVYGWTITEEGEPGKGARFVINIPKLTCK